MLSRGLRKYISNPAIGLLPIVLYIILHTSNIEEGEIIIIALIFSILAEIATRLIYKNKIFSFTFIVSSVALFLTLLTWSFTKDIIYNKYAYITICEIFAITIISFLRLFKNYLEIKVFASNDINQKTFLHEFYTCCRLFQYTFTAHIFLISIYEQFISSQNKINNIADIFVFIVFPIVAIFVIGILQFFKTNKIAQQLQREEWLPIVTERGEVTGKIAKNISLSLKNQFLHPVIRIALISNGKVFLQERKEDDILDPNKLDNPFEKYMLFKHDINIAARNCMANMLYNNELEGELKFILKYVFDNPETKRLIFFFTMKIQDENYIKKTDRMYGKFWSIKQIEEELSNKIFSQCFELEYSYVKNIMSIHGDDIKSKKS